MKTKYIIYLLLALLVGYLIYNKFFSAKAKKRQATEQGGRGGAEGGGKKGEGGKGGGGGRKNGPIPVQVMIVKDTVLNNYIDVSQLDDGVYIAEIKIREASVRRRWVKM